jgi:photosystem II stability/assembly factor-like uncharacterized protein
MTCGRAGIASDAGRTWRTVIAPLPAGIAALADLWLTGGGEGWTIGDDGSGNVQILHTTDGGANWFTLIRDEASEIPGEVHLYTATDSGGNTTSGYSVSTTARVGQVR